jgi:hypothetical protein
MRHLDQLVKAQRDRGTVRQSHEQGTRVLPANERPVRMVTVPASTAPAGSCGAAGRRGSRGSCSPCRR